MKCTIADKVKGLKALAEQVQVLGKREKHTTEVVKAINAQIKMYEGLQRKESLGAANTFTIIDTNTVVSDRARPYFDKLPKYKKGQKTMTYAGIGSRETPQEIQMQMNAVAKKLEAAGYTLQSGGAIGADKAFEGAPQPWKKVGDKVVEWSKYGHKVIKKAVFKAADSTDTVRAIAKEIHPQGEALTKGLDLHARNTFQVFGKNLDTPVDFVLFYAEEQAGIRPKGGTGQAVEMARRKGIPTINMAESNWKEQLDAVLEGNSSSAQIDKNTKESKEVVSVDSNQKGLEYALTNPTHTSPNGSAWEKGDKSTRNLLAPGIDYEGKHYRDVEEAYQKLKDSSEAKTKPSREESKNYALMVNLIETKLRTFPRLVKWVDDRGGFSYLDKIVHQPTSKNTVWETGGQDWFKLALTSAYDRVKRNIPGSEQSLKTLTKDKVTVDNKGQVKLSDDIMQIMNKNNC